METFEEKFRTVDCAMRAQALLAGDVRLEDWRPDQERWVAALGPVPPVEVSPVRLVYPGYSDRGRGGLVKVPPGRVVFR